MNTDHPGWGALVDWLVSHGMNKEKLQVIARSSPGAGYGLFATGTIEPSTPLFSIPASALLNSLTLAPHYPAARPKLSCTQFVSLHLLLHRPLDNTSNDPLFGPYISVLPRDFDSHPLTWLWKEDQRGRGTTIESRLLDVIPPRILTKLNKMFGLFKSDWDSILGYLRKNPGVVSRRSSRSAIDELADWEESYLWAWLNVNTRCVYHRLAKSRSNPDNMTLCPILDFANHTTKEPFTWPRTTQAELWDCGPSSKRKFGDNFVLLSPSTTVVSASDELYLRYGAHANSTLFAEYGFTNSLDLENHSDGFEGQIELDDVIEALFNGRGAVGLWMKEVLSDEGYWGDWTMHTSPSPAHPSYRLITTLRLLHTLPAGSQVPSEPDTFLHAWRNTTLGNQPSVSEENERLWRQGLQQVCEEVIATAEQGITKARNASSDISEWVSSAQLFVETLRQEEICVCKAVAKSLQDNVDF